MSNRQLRRLDRALSREEALAVFDNASFIVISTRDKEDNPYGVPLSFIRANDTLYLHASKQGGYKTECFSHDNRVCATAVVDVQSFFAKGDFSTYYRSVIATGTIREVTDSLEFKKALVALCMKHSPEAQDYIGEAIAASADQTSVWAIQLENLTGKGQPLPD